MAAPRTQTLQVFGQDVGTFNTTVAADGRKTHHIDPDGSGPAAVFDLGDPDFVTRSLRGNAVLRWEYRPGSTLFLVWTRTGDSFQEGLGNFDFSRDLDALFGAKSDNIFLVKVNYWLNR